MEATYERMSWSISEELARNIEEITENFCWNFFSTTAFIVARKIKKSLCQIDSAHQKAIVEIHKKYRAFTQIECKTATEITNILSMSDTNFAVKKIERHLHVTFNFASSSKKNLLSIAAFGVQKILTEHNKKTSYSKEKSNHNFSSKHF